MDGSAAIERNRVALVRIVAALAAMAGFALGPDGPEANRQRIERFRKQLEENLALASFGL